MLIVDFWLTSPGFNQQSAIENQHFNDSPDDYEY